LAATRAITDSAEGSASGAPGLGWALHRDAESRRKARRRIFQITSETVLIMAGDVRLDGPAVACDTGISEELFRTNMIVTNGAELLTTLHGETNR
jgi:hypothetical protein